MSKDVSELWLVLVGERLHVDKTVHVSTYAGVVTAAHNYDNACVCIVQESFTLVTEVYDDMTSDGPKQGES